MRRDIDIIRDEINRAAAERADVLRTLGKQHASDLVATHAELDRRLGWLWEELRESASPRGYRGKVYM